MNKELIKIGKNTAWQLIGKLISTILSLISTFLIIRILGPKDYGLFSLIVIIINSFYIFSSLGLDLSLSFFLAKYKESQNKFLKLFIKYRLITIIISITILILFSNNIIKSYENIELKKYFYFLVVIFPLFVFYMITPHIFKGLNDLKKNSITEIIFNTIKFITLIFLFWGFGIYGILLGYILSYLIANCYAYKRIFKKIRNKNKKIDFKKKIFKFSGINYFLSIISFFNVNIMSLTLTSKIIELGYLNSSLKGGIIIQLFPIALSSAMISNIVNKNKNKIKETTKKIFNYTFIYNLPILMIFLTIPHFVTDSLLGNEFINAYKIVMLISIFLSLTNILSILNNVAYSIGKNRYNLIEALFRLSLILLFLNKITSAFNASIIMIISVLCSILLMILLLKDYIIINLKKILILLLSVIPLFLSLLFNYNLILKSVFSLISFGFYVYVVYYKIFDNIDRNMIYKLIKKILLIINFKK